MRETNMEERVNKEAVRRKIVKYEGERKEKGRNEEGKTHIYEERKQICRNARTEER